MGHFAKVGYKQIQNSRSVPYKMTKKLILYNFCCFLLMTCFLYSSFVLISKTNKKIGATRQKFMSLGLPGGWLSEQYDQHMINSMNDNNIL